MSSDGRRDHRIGRAVGRVGAGIGDVLAARRKPQIVVGIQPVDDCAGEPGIDLEQAQQALELLTRERVLRAVGFDQVVQIEAALQILELADDGAAVDGQGRQLRGPWLAQVVAVRRVDQILAQDVGGPRFGTLHEHEALIGRERGFRAPQVERGLPHQIHGDDRPDRDDQHRRQHGDAALSAARAHPLVSTSRHTRPKSFSSTANSTARGRKIRRCGPWTSTGGHSRCH